MSFLCIISTKFIEMYLMGHPGPTLFSLLLLSVNINSLFCPKRPNFAQNSKHTDLFQNIPILFILADTTSKIISDFVSNQATVLKSERTGNFQLFEPFYKILFIW